MTSLRILSAGAVKGLVTALQAAFKADTGAGLDGTFSAVGAIQDKFLAGEPCDVLILSQKMLQTLQQRGNLLAGAIAPLGIVRTGIAVRDGMAVPDIASAASLAAALTASDAIFIPDPDRSTAGIFFVSVLKKLGIYGGVERRLRPFPNGATAMRHLAESTDKHPMGCTQITEIKYTPGIALAVDPGSTAGRTVRKPGQAVDPGVTRQRYFPKIGRSGNWLFRKEIVGGGCE